MKVFSLVVWNSETGEFSNVLSNGENQDNAVKLCEKLHGEEIRVIHAFNGEKPPKTYRGLPYLKRA